MHQFLDASSSRTVVLTLGVFPDTICAAGSHPLRNYPLDRSSRCPVALAFLEFLGPSTFSAAAATLVRVGSRRASELPGLPARLCGALGFSQPLDASFRNLPSHLVSCGFRPWASFLRRFVPTCSPGSLSARSALLAVTALARGLLRGFWHRVDAYRRVA